MCLCVWLLFWLKIHFSSALILLLFIKIITGSFSPFFAMCAGERTWERARLLTWRLHVMVSSSFHSWEFLFIAAYAEFFYMKLQLHLFSDSNSMQYMTNFTFSKVNIFSIHCTIKSKQIIGWSKCRLCVVTTLELKVYLYPEPIHNPRWCGSDWNKRSAKHENFINATSLVKFPLQNVI